MAKISYRVRPETAVLTRGFDPELSVGSARPPVYRSSTFVFPSPEAAELAYLSLKEHGLEPAAIFDGTGTREFLGMRVYDISTHADIQFELMIVATLDAGALRAIAAAERFRVAADAEPDSPMTDGINPEPAGVYEG